MNDRSLHDDSHIAPMAVKEPEPEQPTPAAEVMIELMKLVSALEKAAQRYAATIDEIDAEIRRITRNHSSII